MDQGRGRCTNPIRVGCPAFLGKAGNAAQSGSTSKTIVITTLPRLSGIGTHPIDAGDEHQALFPYGWAAIFPPQASVSTIKGVSRKPVHLKTFLLILVMVIAGPLGNVLLGKGMKQAGRLSVWPPTEALHTALRVFSTGSIWLGVASLLTFFLANVLVLSWADYSYVQPASSVGYGVSALLGYFMLSEPVSPLRWLGIAIICLGVLVVGQSNPRSLERSPTRMERS
jgi:uncharacterized membrane protein